MMSIWRFYIVLVLAIPFASADSGGRCASQARAAEPNKAEPAKESLVLDDMEDVSDWYNGSPVETTISTSDKHVKRGKHSLRFANVVDHTKGEKNYPIGWPRTGKDLAGLNLSDWSAYDFFECWIYVETSRPALPKTPLNVGFYHSGRRRSTSFPLTQVKQNEWTKIVIPVSEISDSRDVVRVQFNISESNYKHADRVDFYVDDMVLTRLVHPAIAEFRVERRILYATDRTVTAHYRLLGYRGNDELIRLEVGNRDKPLAAATQPARLTGEISLTIPNSLAPGTYWAKLRVLSTAGDCLDQREVGFRVIEGPFD